MNDRPWHVDPHMLFGSRAKTTLPTREEALPGRDHRIYPVPVTHEVLGTPLEGPWPASTEVMYVAMGCFWGVERIYWELPGVVTTAAGYMGGYTPNPTYEETCTGRTGHAETVLVAYDPSVTSPEVLLTAFWENHDPTQGNRQGNDVGTAYRSAIFTTTPGQAAAAESTREAFQAVLTRAGRGEITTTIAPAEQAGTFYYAEDYHQQYLHKNPNGYCNHGPYGCSLSTDDVEGAREARLAATGLELPTADRAPTDV
jgi:peptide-methionine (S)-S-oxide reductase